MKRYPTHDRSELAGVDEGFGGDVAAVVGGGLHRGGGGGRQQGDGQQLGARLCHGQGLQQQEENKCEWGRGHGHLQNSHI